MPSSHLSPPPPPPPALSASSSPIVLRLLLTYLILAFCTFVAQVSRNLDVMRMRKWWCHTRKNAKPDSALCVELQEVEDKALVRKK